MLENENIDIKDIILGILIVLIIYLLFKTSNSSKNNDKFAITPTNIAQAIDTTYNVDLGAMRKLGNIANDILKNNETVEILVKNTNMINTNISSNLIYKNIDIRNYLIGVYLYIHEYLLKDKEDNLPLSLPIGKINLISLSRQSSLEHRIITSTTDPYFFIEPIEIDKIVINPGFRIKIWTGIFNNLNWNNENELALVSNLESKYYYPSYDINTPAIIENNTNSQLILKAPILENGSQLSIFLKSIEIEIL
jgi:hypothetical protein